MESINELAVPTAIVTLPTKPVASTPMAVPVIVGNVLGSFKLPAVNRFVEVTYAPEIAPVAFIVPDAFMLPATSNFSVGLIGPIPTLPVEAMILKSNELTVPSAPFAAFSISKKPALFI